MLRRARLANSVIFLVHGLLVSSWVSRIPAVQKQLSLSEGVLGSALLAIAIGSLISMPLTGALITRLGSAAVTRLMTYAFCAAVASIPLASGIASLAAVLALYGAAAGAMDVAMNAQGVTIEQGYRRSVMSSFHALFSVGGMAGALVGGWIAQLGVSVGVHLVSSAVICAALTLMVGRVLLGREHEAESHAGGPMFSIPRGPVITLGVLGFCVLLCEGAMADWIAIFLRDARQAGPALAAAGYGVFSGAMSIGRFAGDWITDKAGATRTVRVGCAVATVGLAAALVGGSAASALAAFIFVGLGYAAIVPNVFAASGRIPGVAAGTGIASVTTMGYFGFLIGPPTIGWLAEWTGLRNALFLLVGLSAVGAVLAGAVTSASAEPQPAYEPDPHR